VATILHIFPFFYHVRSLGKGRGQHAAIKMMVVVQVQVQAMPNGPIRAEQVNQAVL
jgi:hypothetical protein